jgi:hypothetical protein
MRRKIALLTGAALVGIIPLGAATAAQASAGYCGGGWVGTDNAYTTMCLEVNGSGTRVNWVENDVSDGNTPVQAGDTWFPTVSGCTVQSGWISYNSAGNGTTHWTSAMSCSSVKSSGGHLFSVNANVSLGKVCGYWDFLEYDQLISDGCVNIT